VLSTIVDTLKKVWNTPDLRKKVLFTAAVFLVFRFLGHIPVPSVNIIQLRQLFLQNQLLTMIDTLSGGTLANFSVMAIGIGPYITASIIMQVATYLYPKLKALSKEGESGRVLINQYTRILTIPVAIVQSISVLFILHGQNLILTTDPTAIAAMVMTMVAGSMIALWFGDLISERGIGNGTSMIIFAGIVGRYPVSIVNTFSLMKTINPFMLVMIIGMLLLIITAMVAMNEAIRKVTIQQATRARGSLTYGGKQSFLPLKLIQVGVLPIIFAVSIMVVPGMLGKLLIQAPDARLQSVAQAMVTLSNGSSLGYSLVYFLLVVAFTYFSTAVFFNPKELADELKQSGSFIPGVRPGKVTEEYLAKIIARITLPAAMFLGIIAVMPSIAQAWTNITTLTVGGTGLLIVVSVVLETTKQLQSLLVVQQYDKYL
jgi:preprotein translocase subunit SecY